ncbi:putative epidermal cell surface receptor isoform X2 [Anthonomus grandis grandis]|nr:putative epidermal cell surface receptor isoform X2 [Anthonomus grandis grandis]
MIMPEDDQDVHTDFRPTPLPPLNSSSPHPSEEPIRGRALNFTLEEAHPTNKLLTNSSAHDEFDLSDVTIHDDEEGMMPEQEEAFSSKILVPNRKEQKAGLNVTTSLGVCEKGGLTYENGEKLEVGCDSVCTCKMGKMVCEDRCTGPFFRKGKKIDDPLCNEKETEDPCCAIMVCAGDTETEPLEMCSYGNKTYNRGDTFHKGCDEVCICEIAGKVSCKPRCPQIKKTPECFEISDPNDECCKKVLCDVTLDDHQDHEKDEPSNATQPKPLQNLHKVLSAVQPNSTVIILEIEPKYEEEDVNLPVVEVSNDKSEWNYYQLFPRGELYVKEHYKYVRLEGTDDIIEVKPVSEKNRVSKEVTKQKAADKCQFKGKSFKEGEEFNDDCQSLCVCKNGEMRCLKLECPTYFGVDVLDPSCVEWETIPPNFKPSAPNCCPDQVRCKNNGSCTYKGNSFKNWEQLPINVTGCEKRCYCEMGHVECQNTCPPVPALPPANLGCPPNLAALKPSPDDDCCMFWTCNESNKEQANVTKPDPQRYKNKTQQTFGPAFLDRQPSKVLGPLAVYENEDLNNVDPLDKPRLKPEENPFVKTHLDDQHEIAIHGHGGPDDLLQFLHQHPEIHGLPSGSVVEVHKVDPSKANQFLQINDINGALHGNEKPPGVPLVKRPGHREDISLEEILQELHKNVNPNGQQGGPLVPFPHNPPTFGGQQTVDLTQTGNKTNSNNAFNNHYPDDFGFSQPRDDISVHALEAIDPHTIRLAFMVPPVIVGLHGRVEVRYTFKDTNDFNSWDLQVFAPPNDLIATPSLEFDLLDLVPDKEYKIKITITLRDLHNTPSSRVYKIRTPPDTQSTTLPPQIPIEPDMEISDINSTWVSVMWRKFTEYESQFIDGVQLRYREIDGKIYTATPLIHRAVNSYIIEGLKPNTKYELGIFFIPFPGQHTELKAEHMLQLTTANLVDTYDFNVVLEISHIKSTSVEISWNGVPYPEDKYVNIYRAIYQSDSGKEDLSTFKIAKRDSPTKTIITDLKPGTRYRLWLEIYLTNGKIRTSNVQDFITKPRAAPPLGSSSQDKISRASEFADSRGDYYGPLVIVAILAAIAILSTLILLLILVRRHNQNKASITPPSTRISQSAYDNPTYKVEIQQETMGL